MSSDSADNFEDASVERHVPKRLRKSFDKRRGPVASRATSHKPASGLHRRRRRHYGI